MRATPDAEASGYSGPLKGADRIPCVLYFDRLQPVRLSPGRA
jgi:hypothetical protein